MRRISLITITLIVAAAGAFAGGRSEPSGPAPILINVEEMERLISTDRTVVLDIRSSSEYRQGHIPGANLVLLSEIAQAGQSVVDRGLPIITYCSCPAEESSLRAAYDLIGYGAERVYVLQGGYRAWTREKKPIATGAQPG